MDWKEARLEVITGPVSVTWARERPEPQQHCCEKSTNADLLPYSSGGLKFKMGFIRLSLRSQHTFLEAQEKNRFP